MISNKLLEQEKLRLCQRVKDLMEGLEISIEKLAEDTGMAVNTLERLLAGKYWPGMKQYLVILQALSCEIQVYYNPLIKHNALLENKKV